MVDNNDDQVNAASVELQKRLIAAMCEKSSTGLREVIINTGVDVNVTDAGTNCLDVCRVLCSPMQGDGSDKTVRSHLLASQ
jgi:hypothetical protein